MASKFHLDGLNGCNIHRLWLYNHKEGIDMMWILTFIFGTGLFLLGLYITRKPRKNG